MAKRGAEEQITKDGPVEHSQNSTIGASSFASSDVLAKRKILKPRGKMFNLQTKPTPSFGNVVNSINIGSEKEEKLKALGISFFNSVKKVKVDEGVADFRPLINKYLSYYQSIEGETDPNGNKINPVPNTFSHSSSNNPENFKTPSQEVSAQKHVTSESDDEDEDEQKKEIKIQGPQFNLSSKPTLKNSPFTFGSKPAPKKVDSDSDSEIEIKGPTFTFNKKIQDPVFKVTEKSSNASVVDPVPKQIAQNSGQAPFVNLTKDNADSKFNFGSPAVTNFGNVSQSGTSAAPVGFKFGSQQSASQNTGDSAQKNQFAGSPNQGVFGLVNNSNSKEIENGVNKPLSSFSSASNPTSNAVDGDATQPTFKFGTKFNSQPFGITTPSNFGGSESSAFNSTTGSQNTPGSVPAAETLKPSESQTSSVSVTNATEEEENSNAIFDPVATLNEEKLDTKTGEESETVVFQRKTKLMLFDANNKESPYTTLGKGDLKVLKAEDKGTSRVLIRADGSSRILLNVSLIKELSYSTLGNGSLVRVPVANSENKIDTYVLKVKSAEDGQELCKILNDFKSN